MTMVAKSGFYDGRFLKAGQTRSAAAEHEGVSEAREAAGGLDEMTKAKLVAEAERRGVEVSASATKAEILAAIEAA
ncbi:hypothetical protein [Aurantimonas phage AmM-1]|uniref:hypothetical protein n=1 Tax=Aurantimonas phage AmM-1 TaxID=1503929 RepID=UPI0005411AC6|nr:hypothetical protein ACQ23_gp08 [Aurantimonas phage AmM-1]BAP94465.1 hypothetical protein [Aurantimonas phage AmM-1]